MSDIFKEAYERIEQLKAERDRWLKIANERYERITELEIALKNVAPDASGEDRRPTEDDLIDICNAKMRFDETMIAMLKRCGLVRESKP